MDSDETTKQNAVIALSVVAAVVYGFKTREPPNYTRMLAKTTATAFLSLWVALHNAPVTLTSALALGATGDAFLAWDGDSAFLGGLSSFLVAHILYIILFVQGGQGKEMIYGDNVRMGLASGMFLLAPSMLLLLVPRVDRSLRGPVMVYTCAILVMVLTALAMESDLLVVGGMLFAASDSILASDRFLVRQDSWHRGWMQYTVWVLYYSGQLLIALGYLGLA